MLFHIFIFEPEYERIIYRDFETVFRTRGLICRNTCCLYVLQCVNHLSLLFVYMPYVQAAVCLCRIRSGFPNCLYCVNGSWNLSLWDCSESGSACCRSVQNVLSSSLLSKNVKIKIHRTVILPVVCMSGKLDRSQ
jgi:hypothetical protein